MARRRRRSFSADFKREAVGLTKFGDRDVGQVAKDLDLTETALRKWVKRAEDRLEAPPSGALAVAEREELLKLRKQVKRLEIEREILNKATAFFARENE